MAKAGFWLRGSHGKLAGASISKGADGSTVIREIVTPRNPRTNAQLIQRAIMASVMRAYAAGKEIFDHSFQSFSVGSACQRFFLKTNARYLRSLCASEINLEPPTIDHNQSEQRGRYAAPGTDTGCGWDGLIISKGSYWQQAFKITEAATSGQGQQQVVTPLIINLPTAASAAETCAQYAARVGLIADDYYTICGFVYNAENGYMFEAPEDIHHIDMASVAPTYFFYVRMRVKSTFVTSTDAVQGKLYSDLFNIDSVNDGNANITIDDLLQNNVVAPFTMRDLLVYKENVPQVGGWMGIIRSRFDRDLRSNSQLFRTQVYEHTGLLARYITTIWANGSQSIGDSSLILEGGEGF